METVESVGATLEMPRENIFQRWSNDVFKLSRPGRSPHEARRFLGEACLPLVCGFNVIPVAVPFVLRSPRSSLSGLRRNRNSEIFHRAQHPASNSCGVPLRNSLCLWLRSFSRILLDEGDHIGGFGSPSVHVDTQSDATRLHRVGFHQARKGQRGAAA